MALQAYTSLVLITKEDRQRAMSAWVLYLLEDIYNPLKVADIEKCLMCNL